MAKQANTLALKPHLMDDDITGLEKYFRMVHLMNPNLQYHQSYFSKDGSKIDLKEFSGFDYMNDLNAINE